MPEAKYAGPFLGPTDPEHRGPDKSPYLRGIKRGLSRAGHLTWTQFDDHYNLRLERAIVAFKKAQQLESRVGWVWGRQAHEALEKAKRKGTTDPALDSIALMLMEDGYDLKHPPIIITPLQKVRDSLAAYLYQCERYKDRLDYLQQRPMRSLGDDPANGYNGDCSELVVAACFWARRETGIHVPDPGGYGFNGYGNSDSIYHVNRDRKVSPPYQVGDVAVYGPYYKTRHVTICREAGDWDHAVFTSHGSDAGPFGTRVFYRRSIWGGLAGDLLAVVRPRLTP